MVDSEKRGECFLLSFFFLPFVPRYLADSSSSCFASSCFMLQLPQLHFSLVSRIISRSLCWNSTEVSQRTEKWRREYPHPTTWTGHFWSCLYQRQCCCLFNLFALDTSKLNRYQAVRLLQEASLVHLCSGGSKAAQLSISMCTTATRKLMLHHHIAQSPTTGYKLDQITFLRQKSPLLEFRHFDYEYWIITSPN